MDINPILRRIKLNYRADFQDLSHRQREMLGAISDMIRQGELISEETIKSRISKQTDIRNCFWSLWRKGVLIK